MSSATPSPARLSEEPTQWEVAASQNVQPPTLLMPPRDTPIALTFEEPTRHAQEEETAIPSLSDSESCEQEDLKAAGEDTDQDDEDDFNSDAPSTIKYGHEAFDTFQDKVRQLATEVFPSAHRSKICIERIKGGSFNRIVGVNITPAKSFRYRLKWLCAKLKSLIGRVEVRLDERYIVRIPRDNYGNIDLKYDIATLELVGSRLDIPAPRAIHYDLTAENVVQMPYMVQHRLKGHNADLLWDTLNNEQKKDLAKQITLLYAKIAGITSHAGGVVGLSSDPSFPVAIDKFCVPRREHGFEVPEFDKPKTWTATTRQTPLEWITEQCQRWREFQEASQGYAFDGMWNSIIKIGQALEKRGFLQCSTSTDGFHLAHGDLMLYNILAEIISPTTVSITGVLDWDSAVFAPPYLAYKAPFFLWVPDGDDDTDEENALLEPTTDLGKALKQVFEENAGEEYLRFAYAREAILARKMSSVLKNGVFSSWELEAVNTVIEEWHKMHPEDEVKDLTDSGYCSGSENEVDDEEDNDTTSVKDIKDMGGTSMAVNEPLLDVGI